MASTSSLARLVVPALLLSVGCGPLIVPMVQRLEPEKQAEVDAVWERLVGASEADIDHALLLDLILYAQLFETGVDSLHLTSTKQVSSGRVVMEIDYVREDPEADRFSVRYLDHADTLIREEHYARAEVEERLDVLFGNHRTCEETAQLEGRRPPPATCSRLDVRAAEQAARRVLVRRLLSPLVDSASDDDARREP